MKKVLKSITCIFIAVFSIAAAGCGSSGKAGGPGATVSGMAVAGAPVVGTVNIKGANGKTSYSAIRADGSYTVDVSALTAPFIIFAEGHVGGETVSLYSTVSRPGTANVTPATNLAMTLALGANPEIVYPPADIKEDGEEVADAPATEEIDAAKTKVQELLAEVFAVLDVPEGFDIMNGTFTVGSAFDKVLDVVKINVETSASDNSEAQITITDAMSGETYYEATTTTAGGDVSVTTDNTAGMDDGAAQASADLGKIKSVYNERFRAIITSNKDERRAIFNTIFADDFMEQGMNKSDSVDEAVNDIPDGITSVVAKSMVISQSAIEDYQFTGGTYTVTSNQSGDTISLASGDILTFTTGKVTAGASGYYKIIKVYVTLEYVWNGRTGTETEVDLLVQKTEGGDWQFWGDRTLLDNDFETVNKRIIYPHRTEWNSSTGRFSYEERDIRISGYQTWCTDHGNRAMDFGAVNFGKEINALILITDGILRTYTDGIDGRKGLLLMRLGTSTSFTRINSVKNVDWEEDGNMLIVGRDLDFAAMKSPEITVVALNYDAATKTFTPLYSFKTNGNASLPLGPEALADAEFAGFTSMPGTVVDAYNTADYNLADFSETNTQWNVSLAWTMPQGYSLGHFSCWFNGIDASGNWLGQSKDLIEDENADSCNFTMAYNASSSGDEDVNDTKIQKFINISFTLSCSDSNGNSFETQYIVESMKY